MDKKKFKKIMSQGVSSKELAILAHLTHNTIKRIAESSSNMLRGSLTLKKEDKTPDGTYWLSPKQFIFIVFRLRNNEKTLSLKHFIVDKMHDIYVGV